MVNYDFYFYYWLPLYRNTFQVQLTAPPFECLCKTVIILNGCTKVYYLYICVYRGGTHVVVVESVYN